MTATYKLHLKCTDDQTEWDIPLTPEAEDLIIKHQMFLRNPQGPKVAEMVAMKCPTCEKNHGHEATRVVS